MERPLVIGLAQIMSLCDGVMYKREVDKAKLMKAATTEGKMKAATTDHAKGNCQDKQCCVECACANPPMHEQSARIIVV